MSPLTEKCVAFLEGIGYQIYIVRDGELWRASGFWSSHALSDWNYESGEALDLEDALQVLIVNVQQYEPPPPVMNPAFRRFIPKGPTVLEDLA